MPMIQAVSLLRCAIPVALLVLAGCTTARPAPVEDRRPVAPPVVVPAEKPAEPVAVKPVDAGPKLHIVQKGETLIAIALQHGLDYKELAAWNNIENRNVISVGRELVVSPPGLSVATGGVVATPLAMPGAPVATPLATPGPGGPQSAAAPTDIKPTAPLAVTPGSVAPSGTLKTEPRAVKVPYSDKALADLEAEAKAGTATAAPAPAVMPAAPVAPVPQPPVAGNDDAIAWGWPAKGKLLGSYTEASKGIDIQGAQGAPVMAAAAGKVMYSGTGIRGYGKLVIIKHNSSYLSAYAHNHNIVVKEGQDVKKGEKIAEMGSTDAEQVKLHFEIRKQGKPVDPSKLLPPG
jgi:lipoprotein NlpD